MVIEAFEAGYVMKLKIIKVEGQNESLPIVVDESGLPIDKLNFFIIEELRGSADTTVEGRARILIHIELWAKANCISLEEEMANSCLSKAGYLNSLISHLRNKSKIEQSNVVQLKPEQVTIDYFNLRLRLCEIYFEYLNNRFLSRVRLNDPKVSQNKIFYDKLIKKLKSKTITGKSNSTKKGLSLLQQESLTKGLKDNRFFKWNSSTWLRNKLIIVLLYETGIRKGEMLSLTISNCITKVEKPYIIIKQNITLKDPRVRVPQVKTEERIIPISNLLAELIEEYKKVRSSQIEAKKQPPFLFLSSHLPYPPLAKSSVNGIFEAIKSSIPDIKKLSTHVLRHTRFENLERYFNEKKYDYAVRTKIKNSLGGWSRNSRTSENYEKLATEEQADDVLKGMHTEIDGGLY